MNELEISEDLRSRKYSNLSDEDLKVAFARAVGNYYGSIVELAEIVRVADARGLDMSSIRLDIYPQIRKVADGAVLPEVVTMFGWKKTVYERVAALPIADQKKIVQDGHVPVLVIGSDGNTTTRMMNPTKMRPEQLRQVFDGERLRDEAAQAPFIDQIRLESRKPIPSQIGDLRPDKEKDGAWLGKKFIPRGDMEQVVKALQK